MFMCWKEGLTLNALERLWEHPTYGAFSLVVLPLMGIGRWFFHWTGKDWKAMDKNHWRGKEPLD